MKIFKHKPRKAGENGSALMVVLWLISVLSLFVMSFAFTMHIETRITSAWRRKLKAEYMAHSGIELARMALLETADPDIDIDDTLIYIGKGEDANLRHAVLSLAQGGGATITRNIGTNSVSVQITPENARMDLNSMIFVEDRERTFMAWENLFRTVGIPIGDQDSLIDCILDWVDEDDFTRLSGAESSYYERLDPPYQAKNGPIDTVEELALIKGFDQETGDAGMTVYEALSPHLTCFGVAGRININAADEGALTAFLNIDEQIASEIVLERVGEDGIAGTEDDAPFRDINDLLLRVPVLDSSISQYITFSATGLYKITSTGAAGNITYKISCVALWENERFLFLKWEEGDTDNR